MRIYIPSTGRSSQQTTYSNLPEVLRKATTLVIPREEKAEYAALGVQLLCPPSSVIGIGATRHWIMTKAHDRSAYGTKLVMLDDDLKFDTRRQDDPTKFMVSRSSHVIKLFKTLEEYLDRYAHVGVLAREGGNRITSKVVENTRMLRVLAYDLEVFSSNRLSYGRQRFQEDFDVTLQLLKLGYKNAVLCDWVQGQRGSNTKGGCSTYRSIEAHNESVEALYKRHPDCVRVVDKHTKTAWGGLPRKDVIISWKKAYASSHR